MTEIVKYDRYLWTQEADWKWLFIIDSVYYRCEGTTRRTTFIFPIPVLMGNESSRYHLSVVRPMCIAGLFRTKHIWKPNVWTVHPKSQTSASTRLQRDSMHLDVWDCATVWKRIPCRSVQYRKIGYERVIIANVVCDIRTSFEHAFHYQ